jgi:hypothetical protein
MKVGSRERPGEDGEDLIHSSRFNPRGRQRMPERPVLIASPRDDSAFREFAELLVRNGAASAESLEAGLRARHPMAVVRERDLEGERIVVWYVYRDGRWIRPAD